MKIGKGSPKIGGSLSRRARERISRTQVMPNVSAAKTAYCLASKSPFSTCREAATGGKCRFFCKLGFHGAFSKTRQNPLHSLIEKTPESRFPKKERARSALTVFSSLF